MNSEEVKKEISEEALEEVTGGLTAEDDVELLGGMYAVKKEIRYCSRCKRERISIRVNGGYVCKACGQFIQS